MGEFVGQLGFADAAQAGGRCDLADGGGLAAFEHAGQIHQVLLPADEYPTAASERQTGTPGRLTNFWHLVQGHLGQILPGLFKNGRFNGWGRR
jgi:hypothetical protein